MYWIIVLALLAPLYASAQEEKIYRTKDDQGNVIFSDTSSADAIEVEVAEPLTYHSTMPLDTIRNTETDDTKVPTAYLYQRLAITNPANTEAIRSNNGNLSVSFELLPPLHPEHSVQLLIDGKVANTTKSNSTALLENIDRGTHQLSIQIISDKSGEILFKGIGRNTTILRHSVLHNRTPAAKASTLRTKLVQLFQR